ncbi:class I adenylate-forming enzyme family protein [Haloarcula pellucida]|uniref:2-succinylbenzoate-CoA ligase n=1 Tax=Haloarcula pellucida TaxID=1427151 RepID=A0A830GHD9_9EURY|nr:AMP-binding protein [Halomicroarcula pellucida]MBX0347571.1 AMP-binding protein [Halomicroarcula pellucida]GGN89353.1 2-succinylbenzoate-CoA ligase [Halomicroarcula pellucida]
MRDPVEWPTRDLLTHRVRTTPERIATVDADTGEATTYRELDARAGDAAVTVAELCATPGGTVATLVDTRPAVGPLLFGAMRVGATLAPLNVDLDPSSLSAQLTTLDADLLVCERETEALAARVADCPVVSVDDPERTGVNAMQSDTSGVDPVEVDRDTTQLVLFTSGTTSDPKGVRLTVGNLVASATASAFRLGVTPSDRWLVCLPTYHMGGLAPFVRTALYGSTVVVQREFDPSETARVLSECDVTGVSLVPTMLRRLVDSGWTPASELRFVLLGGGPASPALIDRCRERGVPVCPTYGMTETASQIATALPETAFDHRDTVGQPLVCTDVTVVDDGDPVGPGERGELVVDGPTVTPGYLDADRTEAAFGEYGFHTGDIGYRDEDGRLWVLGRVDDRIVTGGENVDASVVADAIRDCPGVEDAAVVGLADEEWGQRVAALVVGDVTAERVSDYCRDELAPYEVPKTVDVVDALPRTASGTVDRDAVRASLGD